MLNVEHKYWQYSAGVRPGGVFLAIGRQLEFFFFWSVLVHPAKTSTSERSTRYQQSAPPPLPTTYSSTEFPNVFYYFSTIVPNLRAKLDETQPQKTPIQLCPPDPSFLTHHFHLSFQSLKRKLPHTLEDLASWTKSLLLSAVDVVTASHTCFPLSLSLWTRLCSSDLCQHLWNLQ